MFLARAPSETRSRELCPAMLAACAGYVSALAVSSSVSVVQWGCCGQLSSDTAAGTVCVLCAYVGAVLSRRGGWLAFVAGGVMSAQFVRTFDDVRVRCVALLFLLPCGV